MRGVVQAETVAVPEAAVHLHAGNEVFTAERAASCGSLESQRAARTKSVAKFPRLVREVLGRDDVFREIPPSNRTRKDELELEFMDVVFAGLGIRHQKV